MKIKMTQALELSGLYDIVKDCKMPIKTAYKLNRLMKQIEGDLNFYRAQVASLMSEFAVKDENGNYIYLDNGNSIKIAGGKEQECSKKLGELLSLDVEISGTSFELDELSGLDFTVSQLNLLMPFIVE